MQNNVRDKGVKDLTIEDIIKRSKRNGKIVPIEQMEILLTLDCRKYHDVNKVLSYEMFLNAIMGGRGIGKTTQWLIWCLNRRKNYGEEFIYMRRYKKETKLQKDLMDKYIHNSRFIGDGNDGGVYTWGNNVLGYLISLSASHSYKSVDFDKVCTIVFDEGIIKRSLVNRYLDNEMFHFFEFISTVFRTRKKKIRVIVLGNNLDFFNPYCEYFKVRVFNHLYVNKERGLLVMYDSDSPELRKEEEETPLFKLSKNTSYHDYHYNNEVFNENDVVLSPKRSTDKLMKDFVMNDYSLKLYVRDNNKLLLMSSRKWDVNNCIILLEHNEINYYGFDVFKSRYLQFFKYRYANKEIEFADKDANMLLINLFDLY